MDAPLTEREATVRALRALLDEAVAGRGRALFVIGEAGLGKTTLLDHTVMLADNRLAVGIGRADVAEAALPFGLLSQALEPLLGTEALAGRAGEAGGHDSAANRLYTILHRLREVAVQPLLIALDDAHWADPDSLTLLRLICRRLRTLPVAVVATARPWPPEMARAAEELANEGLVGVERLSPLSTEAATGMVAGRVGHLVRNEDLDAVIASCAGNPLLLDHAAAELEAGQALPERGGQRSGSWASRLLLSRFTGVGRAGEAYLQAASVLGRRFRPDVAAEMANLSPVQAAAAQEALAAAGLVIDAGEGWSQFSHDLIRLAVYDQAAPARTHLHEAAFRSLLARKAPPGEAAEHATLARLADTGALAVLTQAGKEALHQGAPGTARRHLRAAIGLGGPNNPPEVFLDLAEALRTLGDNARAAAICEELLGRPELAPPVRLATLSELAQAEFRAGYVDQAAARIDETVRLVEGEPPAMAAEVLVDHAHLSVLRLGPGAALPLARRARAVAAEVDGDIRILADAVWAECAYLSGDPSGLEVAEAAAKEARLTSRQTPEVTQWSDPQVLYAELATWSERFVEAERLLLDIVGEAERRRHPMNLFEGQFYQVELLRRTGRLHEALVASDHLLESAELMPFSLPMAICQKALVLAELGRLDEADGWYRRLERESGGRPGLGRAWSLSHHCQGLLALRRGEVETAARVFSRLERSGRRYELLEPCIFPWAAPAIAAHLACDREDRVTETLEWLEPRAEVLPARWPKAVAAAGRAALAERSGDEDAADAGFARAVELHHPAMPVARAEALTDYGSFLLRRGQPARARPVLAEAVQLAEGCGAAWHAERARVAWRRAGGRSRATPAGELTPQERAVADLARAGRTNREIADRLYLSVNTVETHLAHVYRKLGLTGRWQLIAGKGAAERA
ncbi:MAG: AAA family ATPase [Acidimicrobiales bacterium]|nr:AAA family ATPase [Acidimicrobiales bacterium]